MTQLLLSMFLCCFFMGKFPHHCLKSCCFLWANPCPYPCSKSCLENPALCTTVKSAINFTWSKIIDYFSFGSRLIPLQELQTTNRMKTFSRVVHILLQVKWIVYNNNNRIDCNWTPMLRTFFFVSHVNQVHLNGSFFRCLPPPFKLIENVLDILSTKNST